MCIRDSYKDIVTPGGIPAIVDQDLFDRVQQRFEQNRIAHGRPAKEDVDVYKRQVLYSATGQKR